jgi:MFS family permease
VQPERASAVFPARSAHATALGVLALCTSINLVSRGIIESFAVFLLPLAREFQAERASLTGVYSVYMLAHGLSAPAVGVLFDRLGARAVYCAGVTCFALAYLFASAAASLWQIYVALGLMAGMGTAAIGTTPSSALVSRWFGPRLPRAMAMLYAALGIGVLVLAPASQWLIDTWGWRTAYRVLAGVVLLLLPVLLLAPWRTIEAGHPQYATAGRGGRARAVQWNLGRALRERAFWALAGAFFVTAVSTYAINVQAVAYLVEVGFSPLQAASIYGAAGVMSLLGMFGSGMLSERFGERRIATLSYSCTIAGICALALLQWQALGAAVLAFILLFGSMQGSRGPLIATVVARLFAGSGVGSIYGGLALAMGLGGAAGSWGAGLLHDLTGGYNAGFALGAVGAVAGIALFRMMESDPGAQTGRR